MSMTETLSLALWAVHSGHKVDSADDWLDLVGSQVMQAKAEGAEALMLPEHVAEHWLWFAPDDLKPTEQPDWFASQSDAVMDGLQKLAEQSGLILIAGTWPVRDVQSGRLVNRCHVLFPTGRRVHQDKLCLTPRETNPEGWMLETGDSVTLFEIKGYRVAITICLDVELPALSAALAPHRPDLLLVPSMTKMLSGYSRVFGCAKARAVELQCAVAVTGVIGNPPGRQPNTGASAVYLPCEAMFGHDGIHTEISPSESAEDAGPLLIARDIPLSAIRTHRDQAEVWPGDWSADHLTIMDMPA
ncbi:MAG: hypothetical protein Alpg2KO_31050 [Alphaproteobacteria bacterium]